MRTVQPTYVRSDGSDQRRFDGVPADIRRSFSSQPSPVFRRRLTMNGTHHIQSPLSQSSNKHREPRGQEQAEASVQSPAKNDPLMNGLDQQSDRR